MKRLLAFVVVASLGLCTVGCESGKTDTKSTETTTKMNDNGQKSENATSTEKKTTTDDNGATKTTTDTKQTTETPKTTTPDTNK